MYVIGSQSNSNAERIRKLGWKPHQPNLFDSVEEQVDFLKISLIKIMQHWC